MIKKQLFFFAITLLAMPFVNAQTILLKIANITPDTGEVVKAVDFKIDAATSYQQGSGASVGIPKISEFLVKKSNGKSTNELYRKILGGQLTPEVILEYYNAANVLYFKITMKDAFISNFYWLSPECPTCIKMEHQVAFVPKQIETFDVVTGVTVKYNVQTRQIN